MSWSLIAAVSDDAVLGSTLLRSPDAATAAQQLFMRGYRSAATAYNAALAQCSSEIAVLVHQDVFLPEGWLGRTLAQLAELNRTDPHWAVAGVFGVDADRMPRGQVYSTGRGEVIGNPQATPARVRTLDEMLLIVRMEAGLRFDEALPGFHFYGTDICLEAERAGRTAYALTNFCVHNSNGMRRLPRAFWTGYLYMRRKWLRDLPIASPCTVIQPNRLKLLSSYLWQFYFNLTRGYVPGKRVADPAALHDTLVATGRLASAPGSEAVER